ncbi:MAG: TonB-dependent receptor domain-containing protein [Campylobacterota bacterium]
MQTGLKKTKISLAVVGILLSSSTAFSQESITLAPVNIEGDSEQSFELESAKKSQPNDVSELLKKDVKIDVGGGSANAKRLYIRGISEALTSITVDGAKQSKDLHQHRGGLSNIDTELLKSVKVDAGVGAADNGAGSLGGSIAFETVDAQDLLQRDKNVGAFVKSGFGSVDNSYKNSVALYGAKEGIGLLVYGSKGDAKDYKTGSNKTVYGSASEVANYLVKVSMLDLQDHSLRMSHEQNTQEGLYQFGGSGSDFGYHDPDGNRELERQRVARTTSIFNHGYNPSSALINTKFKLYQNDTELEYLERTDDSSITSEGFGGDIRNSFTFHTDHFINELTVGIDYEEQDGIGSEGTVRFQNKGVFAQNRMTFEKLELSYGARYDEFENDLIYKKSESQEISANINGEYFLTKEWSVFAGYGQAVSGANTIPIGWLSNIDPNVTFNGSSSGDLDPQKAIKYEIGTNYQKHALLTAGDMYDLKVTLFDTKIKDPIVVGEGGKKGKPVKDIINDADIQTQGIELATSYRWSDFKASLSYAHAKVKQDGETLEATSKRQAGSYGDKIVADLTYRPSENFMLGYTLTGVLRNHDGADEVNNKAGYAVHDLQSSYTPQEFKNMTFSLAINNLFDKHYVAHTSLTSGGEAVAEAGRDVRVNLKYRF